MKQWGKKLGLLLVALTLIGLNVTLAGEPPCEQDCPPPDLGNLSPCGRPGSILFFPYVDTSRSSQGGSPTLLTFTNTNGSHIYCGGGVPNIFEGSVRLKLFFVYIQDPETNTCASADVTLDLSPNDTTSVFADNLFRGAQNELGWVIGIAQSALDVGTPPNAFPEPIDFDYIIGTAQVFVPQTLYVWSYNACTFRALVEENEYEYGINEEDGCGHDLANIMDPDNYNFDGKEYEYFPICNIIPATFEEDDLNPVQPIIRNLLSVLNTDLDSTKERINFFTFNRVERRFSDQEFMSCFKAGDMLTPIPAGWGIEYMEVFAYQGQNPPPGDGGEPCLSGDPLISQFCILDELKFSGWTMFLAKPDLQANCNPSLLSVFMQSEGANHVHNAGANDWGGNLFVENQVRFKSCFPVNPSFE